MKTKTQPEFQQTWRGELSDYVTAIAWSPNGHCWAACSASGEVSLFAANTFQSTLLQPATGRSVDCLAFSHDGQYLAIGGQDGQIKIWRIQAETPELITTLENKSVWVDRLCWSPTTDELAFSLGKYVQIWDAKAARVVTTLNFEASTVLDLDWRGDGKYLALAGYQRTRVWNTADWDAEAEDLEIPSATVALAWSSDHRCIAQGNLDNTLMLTEWQNPSHWVMRGFPGHCSGDRLSARFAPVGIGGRRWVGYALASRHPPAARSLRRTTWLLLPCLVPPRTSVCRRRIKWRATGLVANDARSRFWQALSRLFSFLKLMPMRSHL